MSNDKNEVIWYEQKQLPKVVSYQHVNTGSNLRSVEFKVNLHHLNADHLKKRVITS